MNIVTAVAEASDGSGKLILIGLTKKALKTLSQGGVVRLMASTHGIPEGLTIDLVSGKDEVEISHKLKASGLIGDKTEIAFTEPPHGRIEHN